MLDFPILDITYREAKIYENDMYECVHCGDNRDNEACMRRKQIACADGGWNRGWCAAQRDGNTSELKGIDANGE